MLGAVFEDRAGLSPHRTQTLVFVVQIFDLEDQPHVRSRRGARPFLQSNPGRARVEQGEPVSLINQNLNQSERVSVPGESLVKIGHPDLGHEQSRLAHGVGFLGIAGRLALTDLHAWLEFSERSSPFATVRWKAPFDVVGPARPEKHEDLEAVRRQKLDRIAALGFDPWGRRFDAHQPIEKVREIEAPPSGSEQKGPNVRIAGRVVLRRGQGKVHFLQVRDWTGQIQVMIGKNQVGEQNWGLAQELDLGDLLGVDGTLGLHQDRRVDRLRRVLEFLGKSLLPPPEKWHGLTDLEQRSRQRYVDLFSNPESMQTFLGRSKIIRPRSAR